MAAPSLSARPASLQHARASRTAGRRPLLVMAAKAKTSSGKARLDARGYIIDNSNRGNIFATVPDKLYTSSPRADKAARQGLGGTQGLLVLAGLLGAVALATVGVVGQPDGTLESVAATSQGLDSLTSIASRLSSSL